MKQIAVVALLLGCTSKDAKIPDDHRIHQTVTEDRTVIAGKAVDVSTIPLGDTLGGLPLSGTADVDIDVKSPKGDYSHANGHIIIRCTGCQIGDDKATLQPPSGLATEPLHVGHIDIGRVEVEVAIVDGKLAVKQATITSNDLQLTLTGSATFAKKLEDSLVNLCLRFKPTDALATRDPKTNALLMLTGAPTANDGFFNIRLTDRLGSLKRLGQVCDGSAPPTDVQTHPVLPTP